MTKYKLQKKVDLIIANLVGKDKGFDSDDNEVVILPKKGKSKKIPKMPKKKLASAIWDQTLFKRV